MGVDHLVDFYGTMTDGLNAGESSDRLLACWDLVAEPAPVRPDRGVVVLASDGSGPGPAQPLPPDRDPLLVALPPDVEALRVTDPDAARAWRLQVRDLLVGAFADDCSPAASPARASWSWDGRRRRSQASPPPSSVSPSPPRVPLQ